MVTLLTNNVTPNGASQPAAAAALRRRAVYLTSRGEPLFAWLHGLQRPANHGVLICPPLGYEQIHSHRALRHLADALARAGMFVCRLDYHGTGDSAGGDDDPDRVAAWQANIRDALLWMENEWECRRISVVGVRLGAALAWQAVADHPVANLALWAPVVKGRSYVREMQALSMAGGAVEAPQTSDIEAAGFVLSGQTATELSTFDALTSQPRCRRLLIVARDDLSEDRRLVELASQCGIDARQIRQPGFADMMAEPHNTKVPEQAIASIVDWLIADSAALPTDAGRDLPDVDLTTATFAHRSTDASAPRETALRERILHIGANPKLFGILTEPATRPTEDVPLVVLLNAGAAYRVGPNRLHVLLARQLAAQGFRCIRMDLCGLGDSEAADPVRENEPYAATMFRDIDAALQFAQSDLGARRLVLMGLCSGAYAAFQAAAQFSNPALVESVLINPLTYYWKDGMSLQAPAAKEFAAFHYYTRAALEPAKWWKLFSGQSQIGLLGALKMLANRWRRRGRPDDPAAAPPAAVRDAGVAHPVRDDLSDDLERAARAGRQLACFFSGHDPGYSILMYHARRTTKALCRVGKLNLFFIDGADHTFSRRQPRQAALRMIVEYLCQRYRD